MAPEFPADLVVLDLRNDGPQIRATVQVIERKDRASGDLLHVRWSAVGPQDGFFPIADDAVYVREIPETIKLVYDGEPSSLGGSRYSWRYSISAPVMIVLVCPKGYHLSDCEPDPIRAKLTQNGRLAAYWTFPENADIVFSLKPNNQVDLEKVIADINSSGRKQSLTEAPVVVADLDLVVLVHGIRDWADWGEDLRQALQGEGFRVALTNYQRFDLVRFLLPIRRFRRQAMARVEQDIRNAIRWHQKNVVGLQQSVRPSIIAHSFGTWIVAQLLAQRGDLEFRRLIFCGSVVPDDFPFTNYGRFDYPILNEVGTRDIWPVVAESITWGYGSAGSRGFRREPVFDRWHRGADHSHFLNSKFCKDYWVPFLRDGKYPPKDRPEKRPRWLEIIAFVRLRYWIAAAFSAFVLGLLWWLSGLWVTVQ